MNRSKEVDSAFRHLILWIYFYFLLPRIFLLRKSLLKTHLSMLFNSIDFAVFLPLVFLLYWFVFNKSLKAQNLLVVVASYIFYGWWDWRFLILILTTTLVDFFIGIELGKPGSACKRKILLWTSIGVNLGLLGFFKYYTFFLENFKAAFIFLGQELSGGSLNLILPVGISFYTFQTLSYTIDIYKERLQCTTRFIPFAAFVSFFPQLVAGPIERAKHSLPQFLKPRTFEYKQGGRWYAPDIVGIIKKVVIADNCAVYVNYIFANSDHLSGSTLLLGAVFLLFKSMVIFSDIPILL